MVLVMACRFLISFLLPLALSYSANPVMAAITYYVAPPPIGDDENACLTSSTACTTFQRAVDLCPVGQHCTILAAPGVYSQSTNVFYYKVISIFGPLNWGVCENNRSVVVDDNINGIGKPTSIFIAQDHAILTIVCMTLTAHAEGSLGFAARQFSIGDANDVRFGTFTDGYGVAARETSKINVLNPDILGNASRFASASDLSQINIGGLIKLADKLTFDVAFVSSIRNSIVSVHSSAIVGGAAILGASYQCIDSIITRNTSLPGGDVPYPGNIDCKVSGLASDAELDPVRVEFGKMRAELNTVRIEINKMSTNLLTAVADYQREVDDKLQAFRVELRRTGIIIAVCTLLVITGIGVAVAWFQRRRPKATGT